jgi:hypothetical protein
MRKSRFAKMMVLVLAVVMVFAFATTAFATYYGWWNNAVTISDGGTKYSSWYSMETNVVGCLGHWAHGESGTEVLRITPQYKYNGETFSSHYKDSNVNSTSTWVCKTWTLDGSFSTRFKLNNTSAGSYSIFSTDVGYFYDD